MVTCTIILDFTSLVNKWQSLLVPHLQVLEGDLTVVSVKICQFIKIPSVGQL